jgi:hypothetical protein
MKVFDMGILIIIILFNVKAMNLDMGMLNLHFFFAPVRANQENHSEGTPPIVTGQGDAARPNGVVAVA